MFVSRKGFNSSFSGSQAVFKMEDVQIMIDPRYTQTKGNSVASIYVELLEMNRRCVRAVQFKSEYGRNELDGIVQNGMN